MSVTTLIFCYISECCVHSMKSPNGKKLCALKTKEETNGRGVAAQGNTVFSTVTSNGRTKATTACLSWCI